MNNSFRRTARRLIGKRVEVDTVNESFIGTLECVQFDSIIISVCDDHRTRRILIRIPLIVAIFRASRRD